MNRGIYTAYTGLATAKAAQETRAGNLANVSTPGYKSDTLVFGSFHEHLLSARANFLAGNNSLGSGTPMSAAAGVSVNFQQGAMENTGNTWDLALQGDGFFCLQGEQGTYYTRNGRFGLDAQGHVVNNQGMYLLGQAGRILGSDLQVDPGGNLVNAAGEIVDSLQLVTFPDPQQLERVSADLFSSEADGAPANPQVMAGYLEVSNTDMALELTEMMMLLRTFEMNQTMIQSQDQLLDLAANEIGSLRG